MARSPAALAAAALASAALLFGACVDRAAERAAMDTLPTRQLSGKGDPLAVARCVYDRVLVQDCQEPTQRTLITRDPASGRIVVMCDDHPGYAGVRGSGYYGGGTPEGAVIAAIVNVQQISASADQARNPTRLPIYSLAIGGDGGSVDAAAWALNIPDKGPGRLTMVTDAFKACAG